jgi:hypothetical protein
MGTPQKGYGDYKNRLGGGGRDRVVYASTREYK